ncbi:hypothetical protein QZH41_004001 [Actinostola sp. cb2023]|nr:hypothetical protein QZH41_004001 [Actinostola sp. cb2023]
MWFIDYLFNVYIVNCVLNVVFAIVAILGNSVVLYAIRQTPSLHKPSSFLVCNLAITDLAVGLLVQPLYVVYKIAEMSGLADVACYSGVVVNMLANLFSGMSFITVTCISVDRYLALFLHLRYVAIVTSQRIVKVLVALWIINVFIVSFYPWKVSIALGVGILIVLTCLVLSTITFFQIHRIVRKHKKQIHHAMVQHHPKPCQLQGLNLPKYLKSVLTMGYVYLLMVLCYLPYMVTLCSRLLIGLTKEYKLALNVTTTVIYINSAMNPLLYCYRLREFRVAMLRVLGRRTDQNEVFPDTFNSVSRIKKNNESAAVL